MLPQLLPWIDRDDSAELVPACGSEPFSDVRFGTTYQLARRAAATVVDPVVGVWRNPHLWFDEQAIEAVDVHASDGARPLYTELGFVTPHATPLRRQQLKP